MTSSSTGIECTSTPCPSWVREFGGPPSTVVGPHLAVDAAGNTWIAATLTGAVDFGLGSVDTLKKAPVLVELDPEGNTLQAKLAAVTSDEATFDWFARSASGTFFALGQHRASMDFGDGVTIGPAVGLDPYLVAFDAAGHAQWVKAGNAQPFALAAADDGSVVVAGNIGGGNFDGHGTSGGSGGFAMKFGPDGAWQWTASLGSNQGEFAFSAAADSAGDWFVGVNQSIFGWQFVTLQKLDHATGSVMWTLAVPTPYANGWVGPAVVDTLGHARMTGFIVTGANSDESWAGPPYVFDVDGSGTPDPTRSVVLGATDEQQPGTTIAVDAQGRTALAGVFAGTLTLGGDSFVASGPRDVFLTMLDSSTPPAIAWAKHVGGLGVDSSSGVGAQAVAFDPVGALVFATDFSGTVDLGSGGITAASRSVVVAKYPP